MWDYQDLMRTTILTLSSDHTLLMVIANNKYDNHYGISGMML